MAIYVTLYKLTDHGASNIKDAPKRIDEAVKRWKAMGGKLLGFYAILGEYDYVSISEHPDEDAVVRFNLELSSLGSVRATTLKAFSLAQFAQMLEKLP